MYHKIQHIKPKICLEYSKNIHKGKTTSFDTGHHLQVIEDYGGI